MKKYKKELLWTILEIAIFDDFVDDNDLENIFKLIKDFEEKYSRFKVWNYLWSLNKQKKAKIDDDFSNEEEREEYIKSYEEDLEKLITMSNKIQNGNYKPKIELKLYPEYECFLIDCIRHNF